MNVVRNLGVILDENMTMSEHIARVCRNCYYQLRQIRRIKRSMTAYSITLLVLASVHSRLDYCNSVLYSLPWSRLQLLQSVLRVDPYLLSLFELYLGVKMESSLTYHHHLESLKMDIASSVALIRILAETTWGADAATLRISVLALVF